MLASFLCRPDIFLSACWRKIRQRPPRCLARTAWGDTLEVEPRRFIGAKIYMRGVHELAVCEALWRLTRPCDRAVDVGANIGVMTSVLSRRAAEVLAFEAHPQLFGQLERNVRRWNRNISVMQRAVSNESGYVKLCEGNWFGINEGTASIEHENEKEYEDDAAPIEVTAVRLDDAVESCDVMKVDVEGHEFEVLEGTAGLLNGRGVRDIAFESGFPSRTHDLLAGYGYEVFELREGLWGPALVEAKTQRPRADYLATLDAERARRIMGKRGWKVLWGRADCKWKLAKQMSASKSQISNLKSQIAALVLLAAPLTGACAALLANADVTTYAVKGVFKEAKSGGRTAVIAHENIPGYMEAMTMPFNVKSPAEISALEPGDVITFRLSVTDTDDWIDQVKKVGRARPRTIAEAGPPMRADSLGDVGAGEPVPECVLTNQVGHSIRMADFKGQALAFTFFFSRCPLPTYCPRMHNNFAAAQHALAEGTRTNWQLLSISFDPAFDTPEQLSDVAARQKVDAAHWNFATASSAEVRKLGGSFGLEFWRENGTLNHNLRTVVVNAQGRVQRVFRGNEWQPSELVAEMAKAMGAPEAQIRNPKSETRNQSE